MAVTWNVQPTMVQQGGVNISGYVSHSFRFEYNTESATFTEATLVVRVIDTPSSTARNNAIALAGSAATAVMAPEIALRPTIREIRPVSGDTITLSLGSISQGQSTLSSADVAGVDQL